MEEDFEVENECIDCPIINSMSLALYELLDLREGVVIEYDNGEKYIIWRKEKDESITITEISSTMFDPSQLSHGERVFMPESFN